MEIINCQYLGHQLGNRSSRGQIIPLYSCRHPAHENTVASECAACPHRRERFEIIHEKKHDKFTTASPAPKLVRQPDKLMKCRGAFAPLGNLYHGASAFLVLSGPSLNKLDLSLLEQRGVLTLAVNNAATVFRPRLWIHIDQAVKFHSAVWRDPGILKFVTKGEVNRRVRVRDGENFCSAEQTYADMPGVFAYHRNVNFNPQTWLTEASINSGNGREEAAKNGHPRVITVFLAALRLLFYLGCHKVYLLGCDWQMRHNQDNYAFRERKRAEGVNHNNDSYRKIEVLLKTLLPVFAEHGLQVYNCNPGSRLTLFPHKPYAEALAEVTAACHDVHDTEGWYEVG